MERYLFAILIIPLGVLFAGLGLYAMKRKKPMWFWSGSTVRPEEITDIPAYNRANGWMWITFSAVFWIAAVLSLLRISAAGTVLVAGCILGIPVLILTYNRIYNRYAAKKRRGAGK